MLSTRLVLCFFFFRQKTEYEMRISDWISDFCSSDLEWPPDDASPKITSPACTRLPVSASSRSTAPTVKPARSYSPSGYMPGISAVDRNSVVSGKSVSVRVDIGGRRIHKKNK